MDAYTLSGINQRIRDCLAFNACAPTRFKRNTVERMIHRIHRASSTWPVFHNGLENARNIRENNQYTPAFNNPLVRIMSKIMGHLKGMRHNTRLQRELLRTNATEAVSSYNVEAECPTKGRGKLMRLQQTYRLYSPPPES